MAEQPISSTNFIRDFEATLGALDTALTDATRAVAAIRTFVPQISALAQVVTTIESAVTQARQNIDVVASAPTPAPAVAPTPAATLRAVEPAPQPEPVSELTVEKQSTGGGTQCVRLQITKSNGPLDLKTVDNAVNEHPEIVDLALLDYDGRQATLKVWISGPIERQALEQSLSSDLMERIGEGSDVKIEFDQESAAA
jgi:hypothetical protein